jgi:hypothetical protein
MRAYWAFWVWCNYRLGRYDEAIRLYKSLLARSFDERSAQFDLGLVFPCEWALQFGCGGVSARPRNDRNMRARSPARHLLHRIVRPRGCTTSASAGAGFGSHRSTCQELARCFRVCGYGVSMALASAIAKITSRPVPETPSRGVGVAILCVDTSQTATLGL